MASMDFVGRTVIVTGAGGGLGRVLTAAFSAQGARVIGSDQDASAVPEDAVARRAFDISDPAAADAAALAILAETGVPDVLVNNAGWTRAEAMAAMTPDAIGKEIDLNLTGALAFTAPLAAAMAERGRGAVVFISSVNALSHFGNPAYSAAKAGLIAFMRAIAVEYGPRGVRCNAVCPGSIRTPAWDHRIARDPEIPGKLQRLYPLGRIVTAAEVTEAVTFLASDRASGITGVALPVDAGLTAGSRPFIEDILG